MTGFVMVPAWFLDRHPSGSALLAYVALASFGSFNPGTGRYEECRPSIPTLAKKAGISESQLRRGLAECVDLGGVAVAERRQGKDGGSAPTVYWVVFGDLVPPVTGGGTAGDTPPGTAGDTGGVSPAVPNQEVLTKNPSPRPSASQRGTRLPEGWRPSDDLLNWARENAPGVGWSEHEKFVDYWVAVAGAKGVKLDWEATWRNWMRRASEQRGARPVSGPPAGQYKNSAEQQIDRQKIRRARAKVLDELMDRGANLDQAKAAIEGMTDEDFLKAVAPSMAVGYIDGDVIDSEQRPEVES